MPAIFLKAAILRNQTIFANAFKINFASIKLQSMTAVEVAKVLTRKFASFTGNDLSYVFIVTFTNKHHFAH